MWQGFKGKRLPLNPCRHFSGKRLSLRICSAEVHWVLRKPPLPHVAILPCSPASPFIGLFTECILRPKAPAPRYAGGTVLHYLEHGTLLRYTSADKVERMGSYLMFPPLRLHLLHVWLPCDDEWLSACRIRFGGAPLLASSFAITSPLALLARWLVGLRHLTDGFVLPQLTIIVLVCDGEGYR